MPRVSVIIPTTRRRDLVQRALHSVASQTIADLEIIVVVDGPNPDTVAALRDIDEPRLRIIENASSQGAGAARNRGAAAATGAWVAFLDDDDVWAADKLERQLAAAGAAPALVSCRTRVVTPHRTYVWPRSLYDGRMTVDEYLFGRRSLFHGDAHVDTSSLLLPTELFRRTQFGTTRHQEDTTLLLRVTRQAGVPLLMLPDVLMTAYREDDARDSLGDRYDWRQMLHWADATAALLSRRAYSGFCLIYLGSQAARRGDYAGFPTLLARAVRRGDPTALQLLLFVTFWVTPAGLRRKLRARLSRGRGDRARPAPVAATTAH